MLEGAGWEIRGPRAGKQNVESPITSEFFVGNLNLQRIDGSVVGPVGLSPEQVHSHRGAYVVQESRNIILNVGLREKPGETFKVIKQSHGVLRIACFASEAKRGGLAFHLNRFQ